MLDDAGGIAAIYNQGIEERQATFETRLQDAQDIARILAAPGGLPFLVAHEGEQLLGWARVISYSDRSCYSGVGEASLYVDRAARGRGVGRELLRALAGTAEGLGYWKLIGLVFPENRASVALFESEGYRRMGTFRRHGRLDGSWRDVLLVERLLGEAVAPG
ncbi:MAG: arsinothricin resistance N-acetyltransferase ArsN1 family A [Thermoleophilaceae bacterium]